MIKLSDSSKFKLIKSKLPLKPAFKIGASSLKHKKIRLVFTVFLSLVAFTLFGIADTFASYDHIVPVPLPSLIPELPMLLSQNQ